MNKNTIKMLCCLGERIKQARLQNGITQEVLAEKVNISRISIARYENGDMIPKLHNLVAISRILHVSTDYLLGLDEENRGREYLSAEAEAALKCFVCEIRKQDSRKREGEEWL